MAPLCLQIPWLTSVELEGVIRSVHINLNGLGKVAQDAFPLWIFVCQENCNSCLQKLILTLKHRLWISQLEERMIIINVITSPLKISSVA